MLQPNELRVGNIVTHDDYSSELFIVKSIYEEEQEGEEVYIIDTLGGKNEGWGNPLELINPIPLTDEILLKCGFERSKSVYSTFVMKVEAYPLSSNLTLYVYLNESPSATQIRMIQGQNRNGNILSINSVHQLQNLYFALTGKELDVKL